MIRHGLFLLTVFLFFTVSSMAQVAINDNGSAPHESAILDINSFDSNKGLLLPRVSITSLTNEPTPVITSPAEGLIVFNINESDPDIPKGFYYWSEDDGGKWTQMLGDNNYTNNTWSQAFFQAGELYELNDLGSGTTVNLNNPSSTYGWTTATAGEFFGDVSSNLTTDGDRIIVGEDGLYKIEVTGSISGSNGNQVRTCVFKRTGTELRETRVLYWVKLQATGDIMGGSAQGLLHLSAGETIEVRFNSTSSGESININALNLIINKVGE